ncbi:MAG: hypothetical protein HYZ73_01075, partial [Elusimicrobia bacterium]|nr:hypothetical protein [Elusimicrobiota bacterium]
MKSAKRSVACGVVVVFLYSTLATPFAQANFWDERRQAVQDMKEGARAGVGSVKTFASGAHVKLSAPYGAHSTLASLPELSRAEGSWMNRVAPVLQFPQLSQKGFTPPIPGPGSLYVSPTALKRYPVLGGLPFAHGTVQALHLAPGHRAPLVIHIQDAHQVVEAQRNIAGIIQNLVDHHGVHLIGIEGALGRLHPDPYRTFPTREIAKELAEYLLEQGFIGGPEYAAILAEQVPEVWGVEHRDHYLANIQAFKDSLLQRAKIQEYEQTLTQHLQQLKARFYTTRLQQLDTQLDQYESGKLGLGAHVRWLLSAVPASTSLARYPQLQSFLRTLATEEQLNLPQAERERNRQQKGLELGSFRHLQNYLAYSLETERIDKEQLFQEVSHLQAAVQTALATEELQRRVADLSQDIRLLKKLWTHGMTATDWTRYQVLRPRILTIGERVARLANAAQSSEPPELATTLAPFERFYQEALARDRALFTNLLTKMSNLRQQTAILVTGGFHTEGVTQLLKKRGFSYVTVVPKVTTVPKDHHPLDVLVQDKTPIERLFTGEKIFLKPPVVALSKSGDILPGYLYMKVGTELLVLQLGAAKQLLKVLQEAAQVAGFNPTARARRLPLRQLAQRIQGLVQAEADRLEKAAPQFESVGALRPLSVADSQITLDHDGIIQQLVIPQFVVEPRLGPDRVVASAVSISSNRGGRLPTANHSTERTLSIPVGDHTVQLDRLDSARVEPFNAVTKKTGADWQRWMTIGKRLALTALMAIFVGLILAFISSAVSVPSVILPPVILPPGGFLSSQDPRPHRVEHVLP